MGFFDDKGLAQRYMKEGKGVDKNEPKKKGYFLYWDIVLHKLTKFLGLNTLYSLASLLWIIFLYIIAPVRLEFAQSIVAGMEGAEYAAQSMLFGMRAMFAVVVFNLWGCAPVSASYAYITRSYTRGEHAWIISDGWDKFKENFKKSVILLIIDAIVIFMGVNSLYFYYVNYTSSGEYMWFLMCCLLFMGLFLYTIMHYYVYQIMVTFECSFMQMIKNAMLCAVAHLPMAIFHTLLSVVLIVVMSFAIFPGFVIVFNFVIGLCLTRYPMEFYATRVLDKMIKSKEKNKAKITYMSEEL